ncbi:MAG TPA: hypothetical protein VE153_20175 [Myxococcus sp.]|nr:hypothetical protein [Myxococcus sp.]
MAWTPSSVTSSVPCATVRASSRSAPQTSNSPTFAAPGTNAPSCSPSVSTLRIRARAMPPRAWSPRSSGCQCTKVKQNRPGWVRTTHASAPQKTRKEARKPCSSWQYACQYWSSVYMHSSCSVKRRTSRAKLRLLPYCRYIVPTEMWAARASSQACTFS